MNVERTDKNKDESILVICRYRPSAEGSKKNNYEIQTKHFETRITEDVLHWYITPQEMFEKKPCAFIEENLAWWSYYWEAKARKTS